MRLFLLLFLLVSYTLAKESFYRCMESALPSQCLEGFYEVPDFLIFKGGYVYVFVHEGRVFAYGVGNLDKSPPALDRYNPNKLLRARLDRWVVFLRDLVIEESGANRGKLHSGLSYNFQNGSTYYTKGEVLENGDLDLGFSLDSFHILGKGFVWRRMEPAEIAKLNLQSIPLESALATIPDSNQNSKIPKSK